MLRILIVDHSDDVRWVTKLALGLEGHRVIAIRNESQALQAVTSTYFDSFLIDLDSVEDRAGFMAALRSLAATTSPHPLIAAVAWSADSLTEKEIRSYGFDSFLQKPTGITQLSEALHGRSCSKCGCEFLPGISHIYCTEWHEDRWNFA